MATELPQGWLMTHEEYGGSGYGDEIYPPTLYRWETRTVGHLWWRHRRFGWWFIKSFPFQSEQDAIHYAIRTEAMLRLEQERAR